jgi:PAS domain S-box-containing protein
MSAADAEYREQGSNLSIQYAVSRELLASSNLATTAARILETIGRRLGMETGALWQVDDAAEVLRCIQSWRAASLAASAFESASLRSTFARGVGLPGVVWKRGEPLWVADVSQNHNFPRMGEAAAAELHAAFAFPIRGSSGILGVFEFYRRDDRAPDQDLLHTVATLGNQVGQVMERSRAQQELRAREALLRATLETSLDAIVSMDSLGVVTEWNGAAVELFGYAREEAVGRDLADLIIPARYREAHRRGLAHYLATGEERAMGQRLELAGLRRDGSEFPVELTITRILLEGPPTFTGYIRDTSDRRRAEEERAQLLIAERQARTEAEHAGRLKDEFLATLSHELRTPLAAIMGWTHLLRTGTAAPDKLAHGLEVIERNSRAQTQIIEDLLDMSGIISGKVRMETRRIDLVTVVKAAVESVAPTAEAKDILLQYEERDTTVEILGDPSRLQQVIWNLLSNALKFTPKGGSVRVSLDRVESHVELRVADTGSGIPPEHLPHVFDRFRQADSSTTRRYGGLGLGLSIVKQLVEMHGGGVRAESPGDGKGTTVVVSLPVASLHAEHHDAPPHWNESTSRHHAHGRPRSLAGMRVLVVDDEPEARSIIQQVLESGQAEVCAVGSAAEALDAMPRFQPHVVVSDIGMPGEDGYTLLRRVRALPPGNGAHTPVVALTAFARAEDRAKALQAGFHDHLAKPAEAEDLLAAVAAARGAEPPAP